MINKKCLPYTHYTMCCGKYRAFSVNASLPETSFSSFFNFFNPFKATSLVLCPKAWCIFKINVSLANK